MDPTTIRARRSLLALGLVLLAGFGVTGCGDSPAGPDPVQEGEDAPPFDDTPLEALPPTDLSEGDLVPSGTVTETQDGYRVEGELTLATSDSTEVTLLDADLNVRFDDQGRVRSISGRARIASPHERITFEDPVRADVGFFNGGFLNQERDLGILLRDDTDYFVFDIALTFQMNVATGETGEDAIKPLVVRVPQGGRALMVIDYTDPMYYVYGSHDQLGALGVGWSWNQRIPYVPDYPVGDIGTFDGGTVRAGSFTAYRIIGVDGVMVDNEYTEVHLAEEDPLASELRSGYVAGVNGAISLDLFLNDIAGIELPLAAASAGFMREISTDDLFRGYAFVRGETTNDFSWWPPFIPLTPTLELEARGRIEDSGSFEVGLEGEYGWAFPGGSQSMAGGFDLRNDAMTLTGVVATDEIEWRMTGEVTADATTAAIEPPEALVDALESEVNAQVLPRIEEAQAAWDNYRQATEDYEFELSLRGLRSALPTIADEAKSALSRGINRAIASQDGKLWESAFRNHLRSADNAYHAQLDALKAAALEIRDNDQTRTQIEAALRGVAARKFFSTTYRFRVLGRTVFSTTVRFRILSDEHAARLLEAADNVQHIKETSDIMVSMRQIYEQVDDRELFEQVRDDIQDGLLVLRSIEGLGFVSPHRLDEPRFDYFVQIDGERYELGALPELSTDALMVELPAAMIEALTRN